MSMPSSAPTLIAPSPAATTADGRVRTYEVRTFGCQMNVHDSERLSGSLESAGYIRAELGDEADVIVINTCAVRDNAAGKLYGIGYAAIVEPAQSNMGYLSNILPRDERAPNTLARAARRCRAELRGAQKAEHEDRMNTS